MRIAVTVAMCLGIWCLSPAFAEPTPQMSHEEMLEAADVVVEGSVIGVTLTKRWMGDRPGVDIGYEQGDFDVWFLISDVIKGRHQKDQTLQYFVHAYMDRGWQKPPMYRGTGGAITPGTGLRVYLKWDEEHKRFQRVDFNSGFVVLRKSESRYPDTVGVPFFAGVERAGQIAPASADKSRR